MRTGLKRAAVYVAGGVLLVGPLSAKAQLNLGSSGTGQCVGVTPGGATDCRAVDATLVISGTFSLDALSFQIPSAAYGPGRWRFEDQFGGAGGQINPATYSGGPLPDDYLFGYFTSSGRLDLGPLFTPIGISGNALTVRMFFSEWVDLAGVGSFAYDGGGVDQSGGRVAFSGVLTVSPTVIPEPTTVVLLGAGLAGVCLAGAARKRRPVPTT